MSGWIGVDFDGTLAEYGTWQGPGHVGEPVAPMVERVRRWMAEGREVRIFTARVFPLGFVSPGMVVPVPELQPGDMLILREDQAAIAVHSIRAWCQQHLGEVLTITCIKDYGMVCLYDDRCRQVLMNTGEIVGEEH